LIIFSIFVGVCMAKFENPLKFSSEKEYKILHLTDLHYCQDPLHDTLTSKLQNDLIKHVQPNIVVVTGDIISAKSYHGQANYFRECWKKFVQPFNENNVHYALALGSEDLKAGAELEDIINFEKSNKLSLYNKFSKDSHDFAYYLPIGSSDSKKVAANIWLFNSHGKGDCAQNRNSWGCVDSEQIKWYEKNSKLLKDKHGADVHQIAFLHTPLPEFKRLYNDLEYYGARNQKIGCPLVNSGLFSAFQKNKDVTGVFVGQDHYNDFGGLVGGIELVYGRVSGYGGDNGGMVNFARGARVIRLKETNEKRIERTHYVITENLQDKKNRFEIQRDKLYLLRTGFRQDVCRVADTEESVFITLVFIMTAALIITVISIGFHQFVNKKMILDFQKKERRDSSKPTKIERIPSHSEFMV